MKKSNRGRHRTAILSDSEGASLMVRGRRTKRIHMAALAFTLVLASGCVHYQPKPLALAENAGQLDSRSLTDAGLRVFIEANAPGQVKSWPLREWDFQMLTLAAYYYQPSLEIARAQWRVSLAETQTAGGRPNPTITAGPGYNSSAASGVNPWMPFVTWSLPLETAGKRGKRIARAEHLSEAARLNIVTRAWQVRRDVRAGLLDFVAAARREKLLRAQTEAQQQIVRLLEQRRQAGAISSAEVGLVRVSLAKAQADFADAQRQRVEAHAQVAKAVGLPFRALNDIELKFDLARIPSADELTSADARRLALQSRADILGALAEYAASESALQLEIAKQYPDIHFSPGYQWDQGENKWQLGLTAELPVFNRNQGPIAEAEARRTESAARFTALQAGVLVEIDRAVAVFKANQHHLDALHSLAAAQLKQRASVEAQYKVGEADLLDLLNAQFELGAAQLAELDAQVKLHQSLGALEDAVQRPLDAATAPPAGLHAGSRWSAPDQ